MIRMIIMIIHRDSTNAVQVFAVNKFVPNPAHVGLSRSSMIMAMFENAKHL